MLHTKTIKGVRVNQINAALNSIFGTWCKAISGIKKYMIKRFNTKTAESPKMPQCLKPTPNNKHDMSSTKFSKLNAT